MSLRGPGLKREIADFIREEPGEVAIEELYEYFAGENENTVRSTAALLAREPKQRIDRIEHGVYRRREEP